VVRGIQKTNTLGFICRGFTISAGAAILAACGVNTQPPIGATGTMAQATLRWTNVAAFAPTQTCACGGSRDDFIAVMTQQMHEASVRPHIASSSSTIWSFGAGEDGRYPQAPLIAGADSAFYGITVTGGQYGYGTVFKLKRSRSTYKEQVIWNFGAVSSDGEDPAAGLIEDPSGALYGTTYAGGVDGVGTVFKLTPAGGKYTEQILHFFSGAPDGANPYGSLLTDSTGALYSTTIFGGIHNLGAVFKLTPSGSTYTEQILWNFKGKPDGQCPFTALIAGKRGVLYGTTETGGKYDGGSAFEMKPFGNRYKERVVWSFGGAGDGACVYSPLVMRRGELYGTTYSLGAYGVGTAFEVTPSGSRPTEHVIWSFGNGQDGSYPENGGLTADSAGTLYGSTSFGGTQNYGTIFALTPLGSGFTERVILSFDHTDGSNPDAAPLLTRSGALYGTTLAGGAFNYGTVFKLRP
jgi:uncharacterized repeat protein (TIGR03803 family)